MPTAGLSPVLNPAGGSQSQLSTRPAPQPQAGPGLGRRRPTHLGTSDLQAVDVGDGVDEVVGLVDDHHLALQPDARCLADRGAWRAMVPRVAQSDTTGAT